MQAVRVAFTSNSGFWSLVKSVDDLILLLYIIQLPLPIGLSIRSTPTLLALYNEYTQPYELECS